jgi:PAS domain S-box-containing protein
MTKTTPTEFRARATAALADLAIQAVDDTPTARLLPDLLAAVCDVLDAPLAALFEPCGDCELLLVAGVGWPESAIGRRTLPIAHAPAAARALSAEGPVTSGGPGLPEDVTAGLVGSGTIRRSAFTALEGRRRPYGVLAVHRTEDVEFSAEELVFLGRVAAIATGSIRSAERHREWAEARTAVEASDDAVFTQTLDGSLLSWNPGAHHIYGYSEAEALGRNVAMLVPPDRLHELSKILSDLRAGRSVDHFETVHVTKFSRRVEMSLTIQPQRDDSTRIVGATVIGRDITQRRRAEDNRKLLLSELNHRVKNTLTTVVSIASQTLHRGPSPERFVESFDGRVRALSRTHGLLTRTGWVGTDLRALADQMISPHVGSGSDAVLLRGERVRLMPQAALALGVAFHELATNAARYGALSVRGGRVALGWSIEAAGSGPEQLNIQWSESGGPSPERDARRGFGSELIERSVGYELGGEVDLALGDEGVTCKIVVPWSGKIGVHERVGSKALPELKDTLRGETSLEGLRVLVVEDTVYAALAVQDLLTRLNCEVVGPVATLEKAIELASREPLNGALLDINLAGEEVYPASEALRRRGIPFIFLTGYDRDILPDEYRDRPCLEKPVDVGRLKREMADLFATHH